jgi:hypothetical protein
VVLICRWFIISCIQEVGLTVHSSHVPVIRGTFTVDDAFAYVHSVHIVDHDGWHTIVVRLSRVPDVPDEVVLLVCGTDQLERAVLIAADEFMWRSPYDDEVCMRTREHEVSFRLHARTAWNIAITEDNAHNGVHCTRLTLLAA